MIEFITIEEENCICNDNYYKNMFFKYALEEHNSFQCVVRTYAEMLKCANELTGNDLDLMHANALIDVLRIYDDVKSQEYINQLFYFFRKECEIDFEYLIAKSNGRIKSAISSDAKQRNKILRFAIYRRLYNCSIEEIQMFFKNNLVNILDILGEKVLKTEIESFTFSEKDKELIKSHLKALMEKNSKKKLHKDMVGYRVVVSSVRQTTDEDFLTHFLDTFTKKLKEFMLKNGYEYSSEKNYVAQPKENGYQSIHLVFEIQQIPVEIQIRTKRMDNHAESGAASHDEVYKKANCIYSFLDSFATKVSENVGKRDIHEEVGILKPLDISNRPWCSMPREEIPYTPSELKSFENKELVKRYLNI